MHRTLCAVIVVLFSGSISQAIPIEWPKAQGGNGHYYDFVPGYLTWTDAKNAAALSSFQGVHGNLTTITSQAESDFFGSQFGQGNGSTLLGWLGGFQDTTAPDYSEPSGGWRWVTGEPWNYTNWWTDRGLPDDFGGHQDFIRTQPVSNDIYWDDIEVNPSASAVSGYFVEYPVPEPATISLFLPIVFTCLSKRRR